MTLKGRKTPSVLSPFSIMAVPFHHSSICMVSKFQHNINNTTTKGNFFELCWAAPVPVKLQIAAASYLCQCFDTFVHKRPICTGLRFNKILFLGLLLITNLNMSHCVMNVGLKNLKATFENMFGVTKARGIFMFVDPSFLKC